VREYRLKHYETRMFKTRFTNHLVTMLNTMTVFLLPKCNVARSNRYNSTWASRMDESLEFFSVRNVRFGAYWIIKLREIK
jgi:hypothetical protein